MNSDQLRLDLPRREALGRDDFIVGPSNAVALALVEDPGRWPSGRLMLTGPAGAGKTHLAQVWARQTGGAVVPAATLAAAAVPDLLTRPLCLEAVDTLAGTVQEPALFHLMNLAQAEGTPLLMTARDMPATWPLSLPDLRSRIEATALARLDPPDDRLLAAVLAKLFSDRQITPPASVIPYLVGRMPRSFAAAGWLVDRIDALSMGTRGGSTRDKAVTALADLDSSGEFDHM